MTKEERGKLINDIFLGVLLFCIPCTLAITFMIYGHNHALEENQRWIEFKLDKQNELIEELIKSSANLMRLELKIDRGTKEKEEKVIGA